MRESSTNVWNCSEANRIILFSICLSFVRMSLFSRPPPPPPPPCPSSPVAASMSPLVTAESGRTLDASANVALRQSVEQTEADRGEQKKAERESEKSSVAQSTSSMVDQSRRDVLLGSEVESVERKGANERSNVTPVDSVNNPTRNVHNGSDQHPLSRDYYVGRVRRSEGKVDEMRSEGPQDRDRSDRSQTDTQKKPRRRTRGPDHVVVRAQTRSSVPERENALQRELRHQAEDFGPSHGSVADRVKNNARRRKLVRL